MSLLDQFASALETQKNIEQFNKPGNLCSQMCKVSDDTCCAECLKEQEQIMERIHLLETVEQYIKDPLSIPKCEKSEKCSICGAPFEKGEQFCPYCGNKYPAGFFTADLPTSASELMMLADKMVQEIWSSLGALRKKQSMYAFQPYLNNAGSICNGITNFFFKGVGNMEMEKMTTEQFRRGAEKNNVSLSQYMLGVFHGNMSSVALQDATKHLEQINESQKKNIEINRQMYERKRQIQQESAQRQAQIASSRNYGYSGGASRTCYNCTYYSAGAQACAMNGRSTNAGDYCGCWKLK